MERSPLPAKSENADEPTIPHESQGLRCLHSSLFVLLYLSREGVGSHPPNTGTLVLPIFSLFSTKTQLMSTSRDLFQRPPSAAFDHSRADDGLLPFFPSSENLKVTRENHTQSLPYSTSRPWRLL